MAKLSDLPAELVYKIIDYILPRDVSGPEESEDRPIDRDDHHLLDHNGIGPIGPRPRPHLERLSRDPTPQALRRDFRAVAASRPHASWPGGVPSNPLLPLSLVNRTFRTCAQQILFKNVPVLTRSRAISFLQTITGQSIPGLSTLEGRWHNRKGAKNAQDYNLRMLQFFQIDYSFQTRLACHVRSLQLICKGICSMPKGSGKLFCGIIHSCPSLENIAISTAVSMDCKELMLEALSSRQLIKEFVILDNFDQDSESMFQWNVDDVVCRLFSQWDHLETVELSGLRGPSGPMIGTIEKRIPILNCAVRTMILHNPELDEQELSILLQIFGGSMRTLELNSPGHKINRAGLCRILNECTNPKLECLTLDWSHYEPPVSPVPGATNSDDPITIRSLLDILFESPSALRNLKSLSFTGAVATHTLFERLPDSIVKLAWENCDISPTALVNILSSTRDHNKLLPNLKCCSVRSGYEWGVDEERAVERALEARGACFHMDVSPYYLG
ncbi:hypothetical protein PGT21_020678 [Puccinia graminis f. sp. tritici]|uniref:F-box domain-containing protein n=2 Tax=Puccinia graminis f. sp. tritici TaxID=56615 RepID=A0A5B0M3U2_PUCGR|nr:hypothetical protein PGT21_020678 [Puccinia graminis f. sp. tritici]KAA1125795.1 hypothetical protein PGTUg99_020785 [Puccinia graminis f. sp. tritici]